MYELFSTGRLSAYLTRVFPLVLFLACSAVASGTADDQPSKLQGDERLAVKVDLSVAGEPLPLLCEQLSEATGAKIWADVQVASEKVAVFCKERPASEVMAQVADLFGYMWEIEEREGEEPKYRLFEDSASVDRDREAKMAYLKQGWDASWKTISETAELWNKYKDDPRALELAQKAAEDLQDETRTYDQLTDQENEARRALGAPRRGMLAAFIYSLPQPTLDMLLEGQKLSFSTYYSDPRWRLDPRVADAMGRAPGQRLAWYGLPEDEVDAQPEAGPKGNFVGAVLSLRFGPGEAGGGDVQDIGLYGQFSARYEGGTVTEPYGPRFGSQLGYDYVPHQPGNSPQERDAVVEELPWLGERVTVELPKEERIHERPRQYWLPEILRILHEASGRPIVSDAYWSRGETALPEARRISLVDYMNRLCYRHLWPDYAWVSKEEWIQLRCELYPIARMEEFPADLAEKLKDKAKKGEELGLPELAQIASLSDWQRNAYTFGHVPEGVPTTGGFSTEMFLDALGICARLKPSQISSDNFDLTLGYTAMTRDQQQIFLDHLAGPTIALWPDLYNLTNAAFRVSVKTEHSFENDWEDWPRHKLGDLKTFSRKGEDRKAADAAFDAFIKENPKVLKTKLHHYVRKGATFAFRGGEQVLEELHLPLSSKEIEDEKQAANGSQAQNEKP